MGEKDVESECPRAAARYAMLSAGLMTSVLLSSGCGGGGGGGSGNEQSDAKAPVAVITQPSPGGSVPIQPSTPSVVKAPASEAADQDAGISSVRIDPILTHPAMYATDVPAATSIVVAYAGKVDRDKPLSATLESSQGPVAGDLAIDGGNVIFMARSALSAATTYTFTLQAYVIAESGAPSGKAVTALEFRTAAST